MLNLKEKTTSKKIAQKEAPEAGGVRKMVLWFLRNGFPGKTKKTMGQGRSGKTPKVGVGGDSREEQQKSVGIRPKTTQEGRPCTQ